MKRLLTCRRRTRPYEPSKHPCVMLIKKLILLVALAATLACAAQSDRSQWMSELRQYKRSYFARELELTREQEQKFFPLYEAMEDETRQIEEEARMMEKRVAEATDASDLEYEKATEALFDAKVKQAGVERGYMEKFAPVLTPKQLFMIKAVERKFNRDLMKQHNKLRMVKKSPEQEAAR